jgi:NAD(P)-dependent dehydrogenase (short-subunit alcohol dehydrogenase family)
LLRGEKKTTSDMNVYGTSKIYLIMASKALNERLKGTGVEVFAAHPGDKHPNATHHFTWNFLNGAMLFIVYGSSLPEQLVNLVTLDGDIPASTISP